MPERMMHLATAGWIGVPSSPGRVVASCVTGDPAMELAPRTCTVRSDGGAEPVALSAGDHPVDPTTKADYDRKTREQKARQAESAVQIEQHQAGDGTFRTTLESLISLASRAAGIFEGSRTDEKRQLLAFVCSNLKLRGKTLEFSMRSPFDLMVGRADYPDWLAFLDTVRTERFRHLLAMREPLTAVAQVV